MNMAWSDLVSFQELHQFLEEVNWLLVYWLETSRPSVIEEFLDDYNSEFCEFIESELGRKPGEDEKFNIH